MRWSGLPVYANLALLAWNIKFISGSMNPPAIRKLQAVENIAGWFLFFRSLLWSATAVLCCSYWLSIEQWMSQPSFPCMGCSSISQSPQKPWELGLWAATLILWKARICYGDSACLCRKKYVSTLDKLRLLTCSLDERYAHIFLQVHTSSSKCFCINTDQWTPQTDQTCPHKWPRRAIDSPFKEMS